MDDIDLDFESVFGHEFLSQNVSNNSDDGSNNLLIVKKRIILTDELLGKFNETLTQNEKLKAENLKIIEELQQCRQTLLSHLTNQNDWQKKYNQSEANLLATQQNLELQTNLVAARDSVVRQYVSLIKDKDEEIKKLKGDNQSLKHNKNKDQTEEKKLKRKLNAALKRYDNLKGIIEKLQTCTSCKLLTRSVKRGRKGNKEKDIDDQAILSPESSVPASVCSIDTGFESSLSDSDCDLENVPPPKIQKTLVSGKIVSANYSENEDHCRPVQKIIGKCSDWSSRYEVTNNEIQVQITVCEDEVNSETDGRSLKPATLCLNTKKDFADKYVQTCIIKCVDSYVEVKCDVQSTSTQTASPGTKLGDNCEPTEVFSKSVQTTPTAQLGSHSSVTAEHLDLQNIIPICDGHVLQCNVSCQTIEHDNEILKSNVECQTEVKELVVNDYMGPNFQNNVSVFDSHEISFCSSLDESLEKQLDEKNSEKPTYIFSTPSKYIQLFSPVPSLLSPMPSSPMMEDAESMMEADEIMSEKEDSLASDEENESSVEEFNDLTQFTSVSFTDTTTQTDDTYCVCHQKTKQNDRLDAAVQYESTEEGNTASSEVRNSQNIPFNKYASKSKKEIILKERDQFVAVTKIEHDREEFWKKLVLLLISNDGFSSSQKEIIMSLLHDKDMREVIPEEHSFCGEIGTTELPAGSFQPISQCNKWIKREGPSRDTIPVKPIVVEMNRNFEEKSPAPTNFFLISDEHENVSKESEESCDITVAKKPRNAVKLKRKLESIKMKTFNKVVKSAPSKSDVKENKRISRNSLKRKRAFNAHSEVSCTSGSFTVASIPEFSCNSEDSNQKNKSNVLSSCMLNSKDPNIRNLGAPDASKQCILNIHDEVTDISSPAPNGQQSSDVDYICSSPSTSAIIEMNDNQVNCNVSPDSDNVLCNSGPLNSLIERKTVSSITVASKSCVIGNPGETVFLPVSASVMRNHSVAPVQSSCESLALLSELNVAKDGNIPVKIRKLNPPCDNHFSDSYVMNSRITSKNSPSTSRESPVCDSVKHDTNLQEQNLSLSAQDMLCDVRSSMVQCKYLTSEKVTESVISKASVQQVSKQCDINQSSNLDPGDVGITFIDQAHLQKEIAVVDKNVSSIEFENKSDSTSELSTGEADNAIFSPIQNEILNPCNISVIEPLNNSGDVHSSANNNDSSNINPQISSEMGGCNPDASFLALERSCVNQVSESKFKKSSSYYEASKSVVHKAHFNKEDISTEKVGKECSKILNSSSEETSCSKGKTATSVPKKFGFRKFCESTINELIAIKPPSVEKEIAQKRMILAKVKADGLLAVKEPEYDPNCGNVASSMPVKKSGAIPRQSPIAESVFCRQGMTGRRKTVVKSSESTNILPVPSSSAESKANYFSVSSKQQRIAHVPKLSTTCAEKTENESFCNVQSPVQVRPEKQLEVKEKTYQTTLSTTSVKKTIDDSFHNTPSSVQERPEKQLIVRKKALTRPTFKRSKLQKLKQQCVKHRILVQTLTPDKTVQKPSNRGIENKSELEESINTVCSGGAKESATLQDNALSDSDENICEKNSGRKKYSEKTKLNLENIDSKESLKLVSKLESCATNNQVSTTNKKCFSELSCKNLADKSKEMSQELKFSKIQKIECVGNLNANCDSVQSSYQMPESIAQGTTHEQMSKSGSFTKSHVTNCEYVSLDVDSTLSLDNSANAIHSDSVINSERDCSLLESPLSPPESSNCDTNSFQVPITIPTSPVLPRTFESSDERKEFRNSESSSLFESDSDMTNVHESDSSKEEENDSEAEDDQVDKNSGAGSLENNIKTKLRSWNKDLSPRQKKYEAPNLLQNYFQHHYKKQNVKCKKGKALKNYIGKKKKIESLFEKYLKGEFTENALAEILEGCKTVVEGDYSIIVKYVVKYCKYSSEEQCDFSESFPLNPTQQRLFTLIVKLESDHPTIIEELLNRIALVVCNIGHHRYKTTLYCLARFFTAFCKFRNYKRRAQIFCYDALYCLKMKAHTVVFAVLTAFPECFPNADSASGGSPVVQAMVNVIYMFGNANTYTETKNLRTYLSNYYRYKRDNLPTAENLLKQYTEEIKRGMLPEVEQAMLLVAKFKSDWTWTHQKIIKGCLLQTVDSWKKGNASETAAAWCLKLIAYLAKTPPYEKIDISPLITVFENLLFSDTSPAVVKEACVFSLATLVQMDDRKVFLILKACKNEEFLKNSELLRDVLNNVLKRRNANWWNKFFRTK